MSHSSLPLARLVLAAVFSMLSGEALKQDYIFGAKTSSPRKREDRLACSGGLPVQTEARVQLRFRRMFRGHPAESDPERQRYSRQAKLLEGLEARAS